MAKAELKQFLYKSLGVQEGEIRKVVLMQLNIFLIICASLVVKPISNGLFLSRFGVEQLPIAFILVAVAAGAISYFYTRVLQRYSVVGIFRITFFVSIGLVCLFAVSLILGFFENVVLYLLYIWTAIFALIAASQFWIVANFVFSAREAKRLFGLLGAGAIAGAIFGGYLTSILANIVSSEYLLFLSAGLLMLCIPITGRVWSSYVTDIRTPFERKRRTKFVSSHPFQLIRKSRHLSYMAAVAFVSVIVAKLIDYQFAGLAVEAITDPDGLTSFFGFWFSTFNVISILIQVFLTRRIVGTFGVGTSLFFLPGLVLFASALLFIFPELLFAAVFLKMTDASMKQSINKAAMELLILPISAQIKNQTKTFIDVVVDSIATGVSGLLLVFVIQGLDLPAWVVTVMIFAFAILWIRLAQRLRKEYVMTFSKRIEETLGMTGKKKPFDFSKTSVLNGFRKVLEDGADPQVLFVLNKIRELGETRLYPEVVKLLDRGGSDQVVAEALRYLNAVHSGQEALRSKIEPLMNSGSQLVKIEAFEYLLKLEYDERDSMIRTYLDDDDYRIRIAAMVSLARESRTNPVLKKVFRLEELIRDRYAGLTGIIDHEELRSRTQAVLMSMGYSRLPEFFPVIGKYLHDPDKEISSMACLAAARTVDPYFIPGLVAALSTDGSREAAIESLGQFGIGLIPTLAEYVQRESLPVHTMKAFPAIAARIQGKESLEFCFTLLSHEDTEIRNEAIRALNTLKQDYSDYRVDRSRTINEIRKEARLFQDTLSWLYAQIQANLQTDGDVSEVSQIQSARQKLITLLEKKLDADLEVIFQLLGIHYGTKDMQSVYQVLKSNTLETQSDALEFLENLMEPNLKRVLMPILEVATWEGITEEAIRRMKIKVPTEYECYRMILSGSHRKLKIAVLGLFRQMQDARYLPLIESAVRDRDPSVKHYAEKTRDFI